MGELLAAAAWAGKIYSSGWVDGGGQTFASVEPATGQQLAEVGSAAPDDVRRAVQRASDAQRSWAATPYDCRATVRRRAAELLAEHQDELEDWVVREAGLPRYFAGALGAAEEFHQAAALASSIGSPIAPFGGVGSSGNGYRIGGQAANLEAFTDMLWITVNQEPGSYPF